MKRDPYTPGPGLLSIMLCFAAESAARTDGTDGTDGADAMDVDRTSVLESGCGERKVTGEAMG